MGGVVSLVATLIPTPSLTFWVDWAAIVSLVFTAVGVGFAVYISVRQLPDIKDRVEKLDRKTILKLGICLPVDGEPRDSAARLPVKATASMTDSGVILEESLYFRIVVSNDGSLAAENVNMKFELPSWISRAIVENSGSPKDKTYKIHFNSPLNPGDSETQDVTVYYKPEQVSSDSLIKIPTAVTHKDGVRAETTLVVKRIAPKKPEK